MGRAQLSESSRIERVGPDRANGSSTTVRRKKTPVGISALRRGTPIWSDPAYPDRPERPRRSPIFAARFDEYGPFRGTFHVHALIGGVDPGFPAWCGEKLPEGLKGVPTEGSPDTLDCEVVQLSIEGEVYPPVAQRQTLN